MLYCSYGPLKLKIRDGMLMFCNLILEQSPKAPQPQALKDLLEKTTEMDFMGKFNRSLPKVFELVSESRKGLTESFQSIRITVNKGQVWVNPQKICSVQLFWAMGGENGICLNIQGDKYTSLSLRIWKEFVAKKLARMANLPEPCAIWSWPFLDPKNDSEKTLSGAEILELLQGTKIPIRDLVMFAQEYAWKK